MKEPVRPFGALCVVAACACTEGPDSGIPTRTLSQASHGPNANALVRLIDGAAADYVVCDVRARGFGPTPDPLYRIRLDVQYPSIPVATRFATLSPSAPSHVDTSDGDFRASLFESPPGSAEYRVEVSLKRATSERTAGVHRCDVSVEVEDDVSPLVDPDTGWRITASGEASHAPTAASSSRASTWHRQSGAHAMCQGRLVLPNPSSTYFADVQVSTSAGTESLTDQALTPGTPFIGPFPLAGGTLLIERGTTQPLGTPTVDVRFDFLGQPLESPSSCSIKLTENDPTGPAVLDGTTSLGAGLVYPLVVRADGFSMSIGPTSQPSGLLLCGTLPFYDHYQCGASDEFPRFLSGSTVILTAPESPHVSCDWLDEANLECLDDSPNCTVTMDRAEVLTFECHCAPFDILDDGTGIPSSLVLAQASPGDSITLYNPTASPITLTNSSYCLYSGANIMWAQLSQVASGFTVPAGSHAAIPWPASFGDTAAGDELILESQCSPDPNHFLDFVCWGNAPFFSRKADAESVGKWTGPCAPALSSGAIYRLSGTTGTQAADYDTTSVPVPINCTP